MGGFIERAPEHRAHTHILARMRAADKSLSLIRWTCLFRPALCRRNHPTRNRVNCGGNLGCMMWTESGTFPSTSCIPDFRHNSRDCGWDDFADREPGET